MEVFFKNEESEIDKKVLKENCILVELILIKQRQKPKYESISEIGRKEIFERP